MDKIRKKKFLKLKIDFISFKIHFIHKMSLSENYKWNIANEFFKKKGFVSHQIDTFDDYIHNGIQRVVSETDVVVNISSTQRYTVSFDDVYIPNPSIIEEDRTVRPMYPPEARIRD